MQMITITYFLSCQLAQLWQRNHWSFLIKGFSSHKQHIHQWINLHITATVPGQIAGWTLLCWKIEHTGVSVNKYLAVRLNFCYDRKILTKNVLYAVLRGISWNLTLRIYQYITHWHLSTMLHSQCKEHVQKGTHTVVMDDTHEKFPAWKKLCTGTCMGMPQDPHKRICVVCWQLVSGRIFGVMNNYYSISESNPHIYSIFLYSMFTNHRLALGYK